MKRTSSALAAFGLIPATLATGMPAAAIPPPPPTHATYGPLVQCIASYRIEASAAEAIALMGDYVTIQSDGHPLHLRPDNSGYEPPRARVEEVEAGALGRVRRYHVPFVRGEPPLSVSVPAHIEFRLPGLEGADGLWVNSQAFDGSARDLALLARLSPASASREGCGQFGPPDYSGERAEALYWSPARHAGPRFHCQNGIGFPVGDGEALQLTWARDAWSRLWAGERRLVVLGPTVPARRPGRARGPVAAGYTPTINPNSAELSILVLAAPPSRRANPPYNHQISIQFRPGDEAHARALADRLEFVDRDDRRCRPT